MFSVEAESVINDGAPLELRGVGPEAEPLAALLPVNMYSSSSNDDRPEGLSLPDLFRVVTSILALVASINHDGVKRLTTPSESVLVTDRFGRHRFNYQPEDGAPRTETLSGARRALNAMAAILVRNGEIVACAVPEISARLKVVALTLDNEEDGEIGEAEKFAGPLLPGLPDMPITSLKNEDITKAKEPEHTQTTTSSDNGGVAKQWIGFANPREGETYFSDNSELNIRYLQPEKNHWDRLLADKWAVFQE